MDCSLLPVLSGAAVSVPAVIVPDLETVARTVTVPSVLDQANTSLRTFADVLTSMSSWASAARSPSGPDSSAERTELKPAPLPLSATAEAAFALSPVSRES
ncbi:hypothetical protein [Actinacidiphila glaucinigra]|uniref:hypothetical protein n=1 Tax=Actinacidiphila glaucinigra TaxID=235986 RepID=UPI0038084C08